MTIERALANLKQTDDPSARYYAAWWLGRFRIRDNAAIEGLLDALSDEVDRSPDGGYPLRRNAADALGKLGDRRAVPSLIACLDCDDYYVRESAAQALEAIGDSQAISSLLALLEGGVEAAVAVSGKPHLVQPYDSVIEALGTLNAVDAISQIQPFLDHFVPKVQYASARAMYQLTGESQYGDRLVEALAEADLQLRRAALMDLAAIGYLKAAQPVSETLAENSLKLIALKGILEARLKTEDRSWQDLDDRSIEVMQLMDDLL
ncbi:MAG: HEAT repeat domain-containing protein [Cyanobacteria bacterium SBC]|nr:HEAT repeat domain-containing protein [Cyanobacteria bacterium SBC]